MKLSFIDLAIFAIYMVAIVIYGASFYKKKRSAEDYMTGGGKVPEWVIGMSIFATYVSSISFLALPGSAYLSNWNGFVFSLSIPVASILAAKFFVPLYRGINSPSAYYFLEIKFGPWARIYASTCYLLTQLARMGAILYLLALPTNALFGWDITMVIIITGIATVVYSMLGGFEAAVWTDAVQGTIMIVGALACALILLFSMPEGPGQMFTIAMEHQKFSLGSVDLNLTEATVWVILVYGLFINLQNFGVDQNYIQRYISAKNEKEAMRSTLFGSMMYLPVSFVFFFIGTALFSYYQAQPELLPTELSNRESADKVFPYFIGTGLPTGMVGLLIASLFAAGMSTVSTSINSSATVILTDHVKKYLNPKISGRGELRTLVIASLVMGGISIFVALGFNGVTSALDAWWALSAIFSGGILGLFLLGYIGKNIDQKYAAIGVVLGVLVIGWMSLSPLIPDGSGWVKFKSPLHANLTIVFGTLIIFFVGFLFSALFNKKPVKA